MKKIFILIFIGYFLLLSISASLAQGKPKVVITGARFAYPLVEEWIKQYKSVNPSAEVIIEPRTATDPASYDLLLEAYESDKTQKESRDYFYIARYAVLPIANSSSEFANQYSKKGLTQKQIKSLFFHDIFADKKNSEQIQVPYTIYTRLQKAGVPTTFANYFGYEQQSIKGKAIAGADEHLVKAVLKDSIGVTYSSLNLIFDNTTRKVKDGITIIPVDQNGDDRVNDVEKELTSLDNVVSLLEEKNVKNIPVEYLHFSISKENRNLEAIKFLKWVVDKGLNDLHQFGFLAPADKQYEKGKEKLGHLASGL